MTDQTPRLALPLLAAGQAQKEMFHNEALALVDLALSAGVVAAGVDDPPAVPELGQCWVVGPTPTGAWAGRAGALAGWTAGGWRFLLPPDGCEVWLTGDTVPLRYIGGAWRRGELRGDRLVLGGVQVVGAQQPAITPPAGGAAPDVEARAAIGAILSALAAHGLIAP